MSGAAAFKRLEKLAKPETLAQVIRDLNYSTTDQYDVRSCTMNCIAILKTVMDQPIVASAFASQVTGQTALGVNQGMSGQHTKAVMAILEKPVVVAFSLKFRMGNTGGGDHYFAAFKLDQNTVIAAMGWQGLYDFSEWFTQNDGGRFETEKFRALLLQMESGDINGVKGLCSFLGTTREGKGIPGALDKDLTGFNPFFQPTLHYRLGA